MSNKFKVLMADDSAVVRRILGEILGHHMQIEIVYQARDGADAVRAFPKHNPDVVILDVEMPNMNGLEAAKAINALDPDVPIIMFSSITTRGAEATLTALSQGACDYETKPSMVGHLEEAKAHIVNHLIPKVISWGQKRTGAHRNSTPIARGVVQASDKSLDLSLEPGFTKPEIILIGSSTGGPEALKEFLGEFPQDYRLPMVVIQHMPPVFTKILADRLSGSTKLSVNEASEGSPIEAGEVLIAPGDFHMTVGKKGASFVAQLNQDPPVNFCRPAVDVFFKSAAKHYGKNALAVILTGMGKDGLEGCREISATGGLVLAQDEETSAVWGMPGAVTGAGLAKLVANPKTLAQNVIRVTAGNPQSATC